MRVDRLDQFLYRAFEPKRQDGLGYQLRRRRPDDVHAKQLIVLLVGHDLDETFGFPRHLGSSKDAEWKRADLDVVTFLPCIGFSETDAPDFGIAISTARNVVVIDRLDILPGNSLGHENPFGR